MIDLHKNLLFFNSITKMVFCWQFEASICKKKVVVDLDLKYLIWVKCGRFWPGGFICTWILHILPDLESACKNTLIAKVWHFPPHPYIFTDFCCISTTQMRCILLSSFFLYLNSNFLSARIFSTWWTDAQNKYAL